MIRIVFQSLTLQPLRKPLVKLSRDNDIYEAQTRLPRVYM